MGGLATLQRRMETMQERLHDTAHEGLVSLKEPIIYDIQVKQATTMSSIVPPKPNRVYSGEMIKAVDAKTGENDWGVVFIDFGWFDGEHYFETQERGGYSTGLFLGDRDITPMDALGHIHRTWVENGELLKTLLGDIRREYRAG